MSLLDRINERIASPCEDDGVTGDDDLFREIRSVIQQQEPRASYLDGYTAGVKDTEERLGHAAPPVEEPDTDCDNDVGRTCKQLWPQSRDSWCVGCLNTLVEPQAAQRVMMGQHVRRYMAECMAMPDIESDQEQNWIAGHMATFGHQLEATLKAAPPVEPRVSYLDGYAAEIRRLLRVGRKVGRTIYEQRGPTPDDLDPLVGMMDTRELAAEVVEAVNRQRGRQEEPPAPPVRQQEDE